MNKQKYNGHLNALYASLDMKIGAVGQGIDEEGNVVENVVFNVPPPLESARDIYEAIISASGTTSVAVLTESLWQYKPVNPDALVFVDMEAQIAETHPEMPHDA